MRVIFFLLVLCVPQFAAAQYQPAPDEFAPTQPIHCSWSELRDQELKDCQARKRYYDSLSEEEKQAQNEQAAAVQKGTVHVEKAQSRWKVLPKNRPKQLPR